MSPREPRRSRTCTGSRALLACLLALALGLAAAAPVPALAAPSSADIQAQIGGKQAQADAVSAKLESLRVDLSKKLAEYNVLTTKLEATRGTLEQLRGQLDQLTAARTAEQGKLQELVLNRYQEGTLGDLEVLFGAVSFQDLITRIDFLSFVGQRNADVIDAVTTQQVKTERVQASVKQREEEIAGLRAQADEQRKQILGVMNEQQTVLAGLQKDIAQLVLAKERALAAEQAAAAARGGAGNVEDPTGAAWMNASTLVPGATGTVEGSPDSWVIPAGVPTKYRSTLSWGDVVSSTYGNADNSPPGPASASRRPFNENELTCATIVWKFGTLLAVSYNGKHVIVVCTDRGPYISGRSLDLSTAAANAIGLPGVATVHVDVVAPAP